MEYFLGTLFIIICILLIIVVLLQKGRGGGLGAAFGGAGSSAFGTKTGDVFTWVTIVLTGLFLVLAVSATLYFRPDTLDKAVMPTFQYSDWNADKTRVNVQIYDSEDKSKVWYTLDGSTPERNKGKTLEYTKTPVTVMIGKTLKAYGTNAGELDSDVRTWTFTAEEAQRLTGGPSPTTGPASAPATTSAPAGKPASTPTESLTTAPAK